MERIVLFSNPTEEIIDDLLTLIFPDDIENKVVAYMPSDGANLKEKYINQWQGYAQKRNAKFVLIDNSQRGDAAKKEAEKVLEADILIITGGNTFTLMNHLRRSGLDKTIKQFVEKDEFVLTGFSAGAIVLTPTIATAAIKGYDKNKAGLKDLTGLEIVDFEFFAHYGPKWEKVISEYEKTTENEVKKLTDEDYLVINLENPDLTLLGNNIF